MFDHKLRGMFVDRLDTVLYISGATNNVTVPKSSEVTVTARHCLDPGPCTWVLLHV